MSKQASKSLPDPELEAILEADRLALEQLFEAADRDLREALEADRLALSAFYSDITVKA